MNDMLPASLAARKVEEEQKQEKKRIKKDILKQLPGGDKGSELLEKHKVDSKLKFGDLGGIAPVIEQLKQMIEWPLNYSDIFKFLGTSPPRGILISGPPGTGKTHLAMAIAGEMADKIPFYKISAPEIVSSLSG